MKRNTRTNVDRELEHQKARGVQAPRWARLLVERTTAVQDRPYVLSDLDEEFEKRSGEDAGAARRWYRGQAVRSAIAGLRGRRTWRRIEAKERDRRATEASRRSRPRPVSADTWFGSLARDLRWSLRMNRRKPLSTLVMSLSLGLGIGAVTSTYVLMHAVLFQPPVGLEDPERLVAIYTEVEGEKIYGATSYADFAELGERVPSLADAAAFTLRALSFGEESPFNVLAEEVTGNYFEVTGIRPIRGRAFDSTETHVGSPQAVVVLGYDLWLRQFDGDEEVVGKTVTLGSRPFTVLGVAPPKLVSRRAPLRPDVWIPLGAMEAGTRSPAFEDRLQDRGERSFFVLGRLRPGARESELSAQLASASLALQAEEPKWSEPGRVRQFQALPERESRINPHARMLFLAVGAFLLGVTSLVCLIACFNVASLTMARTSARRAEFALRRSLGATRSRLISMLLVEALIPTAAGTLVALACARLVVWRLASIELPNAFPLTLSAELDGRVLTFSLVVALLSWLAFCLLPALRGTRGGLGVGGRGVAGGGLGLRSRNSIVIVQCAAALVLLVGTSLFARSLQSAVDLDLGMRTDGLALVSKDLSASDVEPEVALARFDELRRHLESLPEIEDVSYSRGVELTLAQRPANVVVRVPGQVLDEASAPVLSNVVSPGYLAMLDVPMVAGRRFQESDVVGEAAVAVINEAFAERYWPQGDALDRTFEVTGDEHAGTSRSFRVVGIARDGKYIDFDDERRPYFWSPFAADPATRAVFLARGRGGAREVAGVLAREVTLEPGEVRSVPPSSLESQVAIQFAHLRIASALLGFGSALGLFLAIIGIYGLVDLAVGERRREMAIRLAVGADQSQVFRAVLLDGLRAAAIGVGLGLVVALPAARALRSVLWGVGAGDPVSFGMGAGLLLMAALAASAVPAARILRLDPVRSLRED